MSIIRLILRDRKLVHSSFEALLSEAEKPQNRNATEITIDLSKAEWVDLSAAVRLVLFIEGKLRSGIKINLAMPLPFAGKTEGITFSEQELEQRVSRRKKVLEFLSHIDFENAVKCEHLDQHANILHNYDHAQLLFPSEEEPSHQAPTIDTESRTYEETYTKVFPLRWVAKFENESIKADLDQLMHFLSGIMREQNRGISRLDADALANCVFYELLQNVFDHAGVKHCLVAVWCRAGSQLVAINDYIPQEHSFFEWTKLCSFPLVDLAFGDSGTGIETSLNSNFSKILGNAEGVPDCARELEEQILFWSLGRVVVEQD